MKILLTYLLEVSICQIVLYLLYKLLSSNLTFFSLNRIFLLGSVIVSLIIPAVQIQLYETQSISSEPFIFSWLANKSNYVVEVTQSTIQQTGSVNWFQLLLFFVTSIYFVGLIFFSYRLIGGILRLKRIVKENPVEIINGYKVIKFNSGPAFYSFLGYIFINKDTGQLNPKELELVSRHEQLHIDLGHSYDLLILELARIICWFNPAIHWLKNAAVENHEYEVDKLINEDEVYSNLILKLSMNKDELIITNQFSMKNMKKRINLIYQSNTKAMKKLYYLSIIPIVGVLLAFFSFTEKDVVAQSNSDKNSNENGLIIENVEWVGNSVYSDDYLTGFMKLKKGDIYDQSEIQNLFSYQADGSDIGSLYMDKGYLFFLIDLSEEKIDKDKVNLRFTMHEGEIVHVDKFEFIGFPEEIDYAAIIPLKSGDVFNRRLLIESQKILAERFGNEISIQPIPIVEEKKVNITFELAQN